MKNFIIKFYINETSYRVDSPCSTIKIRNTRQGAIDYAKGIMRCQSSYKYYFIEEE